MGEARDVEEACNGISAEQNLLYQQHQVELELHSNPSTEVPLPQQTSIQGCPTPTAPSAPEAPELSVVQPPSPPSHACGLDPSIPERTMETQQAGPATEDSALEQ